MIPLKTHFLGCAVIEDFYVLQEFSSKQELIDYVSAIGGGTSINKKENTEDIVTEKNDEQVDGQKVDFSQLSFFD
jgi:hypothetical protein